VLPLSALASAILLAGGVLPRAPGQAAAAWPFLPPRGAERWLVVVMLVAVVFWPRGRHGGADQPDTNAYHAQTIHWIETMLSCRAGQPQREACLHSSWLLLNAAFSLSFLGLRSFHVLPGLLFLVSMWQFLRGLRGLMRASSRSRTGCGSVHPSGILDPSRRALGSGYGPAGHAAHLDLLSEAVEYEASPDKDPVRGVALATIPAFLIVLKLSTAPLILVSGYILVRALLRWDLRLAAALVALAALTLVPWIARSVMLSGYPVYPYPQLDLFQVDWKVPATDVDGVRNGSLAGRGFR